MTVKPEAAVFQHLPLMYRKAGQAGTAAFALTGALGRAGADLERASRQVLQSRFIDHLNDMDDLQRLAALFALAPWPEEDLEEFRFRVQQMARIYLQGAATASAVLEVLGAASDSELVGVTPPAWSVASGDARFQTVGAFRRRTAPSGASDAEFTGTVVDAPRVTEAVAVNAPTFEWLVANNLYDTPGGIDEYGMEFAATFPDPVVDIVAGDHPVTLPILVQRDLRRLVLINRFIPPGATLRVDLVQHTLIDVAGPATLEGPVRYNGSASPLLYGTGGLVHDTGSGELSGPVTRPFHVIRLNKNRRRDESMPVVPGPPGNLDHVPLVNIPWPALLPPGTSRWSLLVGVGPEGEVPALDAVLPHNLVRALPATAALGPKEIQFRWTGRRLATFTLLFDDHHLCDGPSPTAAMKHRAAWLREQIERLKLAGVIYLDQSEVDQGPQPLPAKAGTELSLWEVNRSTQVYGLSVAHVSRSAGVTETLVLQDSVAVNVSTAKGG